MTAVHKALTQATLSPLTLHKQYGLRISKELAKVLHAGFLPPKEFLMKRYGLKLQLAHVKK